MFSGDIRRPMGCIKARGMRPIFQSSEGSDAKKKVEAFCSADFPKFGLDLMILIDIKLILAVFMTFNVILYVWVFV